MKIEKLLISFVVLLLLTVIPYRLGLLFLDGFYAYFYGLICEAIILTLLFGIVHYFIVWLRWLKK